MKTKPITDHPAQMLLFADQRADSEKTSLHVGAGSTISPGGVPTPAARNRRSKSVARSFDELTTRQQMDAIASLRDQIANLNRANA